MSRYWNNHPEEYELIVQRGMARLLCERGDPRDVDEIVEHWEEHPLSREEERQLSCEANRYIIEEEQDYWGSFAR